MYQKWIPQQHIVLSMDEVFCWWDKLDALEDTPEKAFDLFTKFLEECEDQLELNPDFIEELERLDKDKDFVSIDNINELYETDDEKRKKRDIPFMPRLSF